MTSRTILGASWPAAGLLALVLGLGGPASSAWAAQGAFVRVAAAQKRAKQSFKSAKQKRPRSRKNPAAAGRSRPGPQLLERLMRMKPQQRRWFFQQNPRFQKMPARQRRQLQQRLRRLSQMPAPRRAQVLERYRLFDRLPREKQTQARAIYQRWRQFPDGRRKELLSEYDSLRAAAADARQERFESDEFTNQFSTDEQQVLKDLTALFPVRPAQPH